MGKKHQTPPRTKGVSGIDLSNLTEEFLDLLLELNSHAKHYTAAGIRLERITRHHLHQEQSRRDQENKSRAGGTNTRTAKASNSRTAKHAN